MRPSRFRPALTASLRRQKLNGFFIAIVSPVWRGWTIHGCRSTAAPLQTSRPRGTRPGNLAPTRDRMRAFRSPRHHKFPQDLGFRDSNSRYRPPCLLHGLRFHVRKGYAAWISAKSAHNGCKGNAANCKKNPATFSTGAAVAQRRNRLATRSVPARPRSDLIDHACIVQLADRRENCND
jgi:hypothetical protein